MLCRCLLQHIFIQQYQRAREGSAEHRIIHRQTPWHHRSISSFPSAASTSPSSCSLATWWKNSSSECQIEITTSYPSHSSHGLLFSSLTSGHLANAAWISNFECGTKTQKHKTKKYESRVSEEKVKRRKSQIWNTQTHQSNRCLKIEFSDLLRTSRASVCSKATAMLVRVWSALLAGFMRALELWKMIVDKPSTQTN